MPLPAIAVPSRRPPSTRTLILVAAVLTLSTVGPGCHAEPTEGSGPASTSTETVIGGKRLADSPSPYLRLHADNPVDWYPWGDEAFAAARRDDKPIFLSVGYSTCYWCHVMERESFEDPAIAALLREHFVAVKVDREERPDLDRVYMTATQLVTGRGGWPNSVFLTPDGDPFYAGTYFPPEDRPGLPSFRSVLERVATAWREDRARVDEGAEALGRQLESVLAADATTDGTGGDSAADLPAVDVAARAVRDLARTFDAEHGGFGRAPKFPTAPNLLLLLERHDEDECGPKSAPSMLDATLDAMARGGIYDHLGGGFHRYSTDHRWLVPHFEKMLYDQGLLLEVYARHFEASHLEAGGSPQSERVVRETAAFLEREMTAPEGAFWSAIDAETDEEEGAFYVWTRAEVDEALGPEDGARFAAVFGMDGEPSFEGGRHVLHLEEPLGARADDVEPLRRALLARRDRRERPLTDTKILADWNGLAIAGLATAGRVTGDDALVSQAARAARFVLEGMRGEDGVLRHAFSRGGAYEPAQLGDYVFLVHGLLALHRATGETLWLEAAASLTEEQRSRLTSPAGGFFAATATDLPVRHRPVDDAALPGLNAVAVWNLARLAARTGRTDFRAAAEATLRAFAAPLEKRPAVYPSLAVATLLVHDLDRVTTDRAPTDLAALAERVVQSRLEAGDDGAFAVVLEIASGWHVNANPASDAFLVPTSVEARSGALDGLRYPEPETLDAAFSDTPVDVWSGTLRIEGRTWDSPPPALVLRYQACDDRRCLAPVERELPWEAR